MVDNRPDNKPTGSFDWQDVAAARQRLAGIARRTPLIRAADLFDKGEVYLKTENLQLTHAFKFRGAYNRASRLTAAEQRAGLITASSGNHALGLSLAGKLLGARVTVVMPEGAPQIKEQGCRGYGARVVRYGEAYDDAVAHATELAAAHGYTYVQSFEDPLVAAGQATVAWEILADLPAVDLIVAPIGGGGLLSGILGLLKTMPADQAAAAWPGRGGRPLGEVTVVGVQAAGAASTVASVQADRRVALPSISTVADGIAVRQPGAYTFEIIRRHVDDLVTVTDDQMLAALGRTARSEKLVVEPAGAAAIAAVLFGRGGDRVDLAAALDRPGYKVACVISGGNVEPGLLGECLTQAAGRRAPLPAR